MPDFELILDKIYKLLKVPQKYRHLIYALIIALTLVPVFVISAYNIPALDDYGYSAEVHNAVVAGSGLSGVIGAAIKTSAYYRQTWQGLYSAAFLQALQPVVFGVKWAWAGPVLIMAAIAVGTYSLCSSVLKVFDKNYRKTTPLIFLPLFFYFIQCLPDATEGIFWFNGAANYTFFWALLALNLSFIIRMATEDRVVINSVISVALSFILSGGNHVSTFLNILLCVFAVIYTAYTKKKTSLAGCIATLLSSCLGFFIVMTAPGTAIRRQNLNRQPIISTLFYAVYLFLDLSDEYFTLSFIFLLLILTPVILSFKDKLPKINLFHCICAVVVFLTCVCGMICVPYYSMGILGHGRVQNILFFTWNIGIIIIYTMILTLWGRQMDWKILPAAVTEFVGKTSVVFGVAMLLFMFSMGNQINHGTGTIALTDLMKGAPQQLQREYSAREKMVLAGERVFPRYTATDTVLFIADIDPLPNTWVNEAFCNYYNIDTATAVFPD